MSQKASMNTAANFNTSGPKLSIQQNNTERNFNSAKSLSIYIKIFINYAQMVSIIHSLELKWPYYVANYLKITGNVGTISSELLSLDCLIYDYEINMSPIYLIALMNILIYAIFLLIASSYFMMRQILLNKKRQINKLIILAVVLSIMIQPNSIRETSNFFNCQEIENKSYLIRQISIVCYTSDHKEWVFKKLKLKFLNLNLF